MLRCGSGRLENRNFNDSGGHFAFFPARKREHDLCITLTDLFGDSDRGPKARRTLSVEYDGCNTERLSHVITCRKLDFDSGQDFLPQQLLVMLNHRDERFALQSWDWPAHKDAERAHPALRWIERNVLRETSTPK